MAMRLSTDTPVTTAPIAEDSEEMRKIVAFFSNHLHTTDLNGISHTLFSSELMSDPSAHRRVLLAALQHIEQTQQTRINNRFGLFNENYGPKNWEIELQELQSNIDTAYATLDAITTKPLLL